MRKHSLVAYSSIGAQYSGASSNNIKEPVFAPHGPKYSIIIGYVIVCFKDMRKTVKLTMGDFWAILMPDF